MFIFVSLEFSPDSDNIYTTMNSALIQEHHSIYIFIKVDHSVELFSIILIFNAPPQDHSYLLMVNVNLWEQIWEQLWGI